MRSDHIFNLCEKYQQRGALLDSNLLLLYFVGLYSNALIGQAKRLKQYTLDDFETLRGVFVFFRRVVTTPNILTEVSNLSGHLPGDRSAYFEVFRAQLDVVQEEYVRSTEVVQSDRLADLGLTDLGISRLAKAGLLVFTDDLPLTLLLAAERVDHVNFNHLRMYQWRWNVPK